MRNWNDNELVEIAEKYGVTSLPMRNWNHNGTTKIRITKIVTSLPMRNWNKMIMILCGWGRRLPAYLWGIETAPLVPDPCWSGLPAYLWGIETRHDPGQQGRKLRYQPPMRNWNGVLHGPRPSRRSGYQPTYEELKHFFNPPHLHL